MFGHSRSAPLGTGCLPAAGRSDSDRRFRSPIPTDSVERTLSSYALRCARSLRPPACGGQACLRRAAGL